MKFISISAKCSYVSMNDLNCIWFHQAGTYLHRMSGPTIWALLEPLVSPCGNCSYRCKMNYSALRRGSV